MTQNKAQAISIRLPPQILRKLDRQVEVYGSHRTDVIRRALAIYFRLDEYILVPASDETKADLDRVAAFVGKPRDDLAEKIFSDAVRGFCADNVGKVFHYRNSSKGFYSEADEVVEFNEMIDKETSYGHN